MERTYQKGGRFNRTYRALVFELSKRYGWRCWYCGSKVTTHSCSVDHIVAVSAGGPDDLSNLALSCQFCNYAKRDHPVEDFLEWLERVRSQDTLYRA